MTRFDRFVLLLWFAALWLAGRVDAFFMRLEARRELRRAIKAKAFRRLP